MQRSWTEATRTQIQPSNPKQKITNITNSQNTKRTYGQPSEQPFSQKVASQQPKQILINMNTHKVNRHRNSDTKTGNREPQQNKPPWNG